VQANLHPQRAFSIRAATLNDLDQLTDFILAEAQEAENLANDPQTVAQGIRVGLLDPQVARYWVLENGEKRFVGSISVVKEWSDWHAGYYWWIQSIFIEPLYRGKDLLKILLDEVIQTARAENALDLRLYVHEDNLRAIKAYLREGFTEAPYRVMRMRL